MNDLMAANLLIVELLGAVVANAARRREAMQAGDPRVPQLEIAHARPTAPAR